MFGWFKRKPQAAPGDSIASQPPGEIFLWPKGVILTAVDELMLALPKGLIDKGRPIGEFLFGPNDMEISIPPEGDSILVRLAPGMSIRSAKSVQSYVVAADKTPRKVKVTPPQASPAAQMTIEQIIRDRSHLPIAESIMPIVTSLSERNVFLPIPDETIEQSAVLPAKTMPVKAWVDDSGSAWAYAYTSQRQFLRAFPAGGAFAEMRFEKFFQMIESDDRLQGIVLNAVSDAACYIPRELFETVKQVLPGRDGHGD